MKYIYSKANGCANSSDRKSFAMQNFNQLKTLPSVECKQIEEICLEGARLLSWGCLKTICYCKPKSAVLLHMGLHGIECGNLQVTYVKYEL